MTAFESQWTKTKEPMRGFSTVPAMAPPSFPASRQATVCCPLETCQLRVRSPPTSGPPPNSRLCTQRRASPSTDQGTHNARCGGVPETGGEGRLTASAWPRAPTALCISSARGSGRCPSLRRKSRERNPQPYSDRYLVLDYSTQCNEARHSVASNLDPRCTSWWLPRTQWTKLEARMRGAPGALKSWRDIMASAALHAQPGVFLHLSSIDALTPARTDSGDLPADPSS